MGDDRFTTLGEFLQEDRVNEDRESGRGLRWRVLGVILGFVVGAFMVGFKFSSTVSQGEVEQLKLKILTQEQNLEKLRREFKVSGKKDDFQKLSCRISRAKEALAKAPSNKGLQQQVRANEEAMASFIVKNLDQEKDANDIPVMRVVKAEMEKISVIKFDGDDTVYVVPQEVKKLTPHGTFFTADVGALQNLKRSVPGCSKLDPVLSGPRNGQLRHVGVDIARIR